MKNLLFIITLLFSFTGNSQEIQGFRYRIELDDWYFLSAHNDSDRAQSEIKKLRAKSPQFIEYIFAPNRSMEIYWINDSTFSHILLYDKNKSKYLYFDPIKGISKRPVYTPVDIKVIEKENLYDTISVIEVSGYNRGRTTYYYNKRNCIKLNPDFNYFNGGFFEYHNPDFCVPKKMKLGTAMTLMLQNEIKFVENYKSLMLKCMNQPKKSNFKALSEYIK